MKKKDPDQSKPVCSPLSLSMVLLSGLLLASCGGDGSSDNNINNSNGSGATVGTPLPSESSSGTTPAPTPGINNGAASGATSMSLCGNATTVQQLLDQVNAIRAQGRNCGTTFYPPVGALSWNTALANAAQAHSTDMANNNYFSHTGLNGSTIGTRANAAGYAYRTVGENIAAGYNSIDAVMTGWVDSAGHCANMMNASFKEYGIACASNPNSTYKTYWTQEFGATN